MIGLLVVTHQSLGAAYRHLAEHFFDQLPEHVLIQEVSKDEQPEQTQQKTEQLLAQLSAQQNVLILTDIFGATPCNIARKMLKKDKVIMITGINLPMMVKALQNSVHADNLEMFAQDVKQTACEGIMLLLDEEDNAL